MSSFDKWVESPTRRLAAFTSRRSLLSRLGGYLVGASAVAAALPVARGAQAAATSAGLDESACDYWKYCGLGGNLCSCCGGSSHECPVGTEPSKVYWVGTCKSAGDGKNYIIAYRDCCGQTACGKCLCVSSKGSRPGYTMGLNQDMNWCVGNTTIAAYCTTATVQGLAD